MIKVGDLVTSIDPEAYSLTTPGSVCLVQRVFTNDSMRVTVLWSPSKYWPSFLRDSKEDGLDPLNRKFTVRTQAFRRLTRKEAMEMVPKKEKLVVLVKGT